MICPGTIVFRAKPDLTFKPNPKPNGVTEVTGKTDWFVFNIALVALGGNILIRHCKRRDGSSTALGFSFDLKARKDFYEQSKSTFDGGVFGKCGIEICADHEDARLATIAKGTLDLQLSLFNPGGLSEALGKAAGGANWSLVVENACAAGGRLKVVNYSNPGVVTFESYGPPQPLSSSEVLFDLNP